MWEDAIKYGPCQEYPNQSEPAVLRKIEETQGGTLAHQQGDAGIAIERGNRKQIEGAKQEVEDKKNA